MKVCHLLDICEACRAITNKYVCGHRCAKCRDGNELTRQVDQEDAFQGTALLKASFGGDDSIACTERIEN